MCGLSSVETQGPARFLSQPPKGAPTRRRAIKGCHWPCIMHFAAKGLRCLQAFPVHPVDPSSDCEGEKEHGWTGLTRMRGTTPGEPGVQCEGKDARGTEDHACALCATSSGGSTSPWPGCSQRVLPRAGGLGNVATACGGSILRARVAGEECCRSHVWTSIREDNQMILLRLQPWSVRGTVVPGAPAHERGPAKWPAGSWSWRHCW